MTWGGVHGYSAYANAQCRCTECRTAFNAYARDHRARNPGRTAAYLREWRQRNPEKTREHDRRAYARSQSLGQIKARTAVAGALKTGRLVQETCEVCGDPETQAHHAFGYSPEHHLVVQWLCVKHHADAHAIAA